MTRTNIAERIRTKNQLLRSDHGVQSTETHFWESQIQTLDGRPNWRFIKKIRDLYERGDMLEIVSAFGPRHAQDVAQKLDIAHLFAWR